MKNLKITLLALLAGLTSCLPIDNEQKKRDLEQEILKTEADFATMVANEGIAQAFIYYAADDAVLMRDNKVILGKKAIANLYPSKEKDPKLSLTWTPDYVDVSESGDMAYTYGEYLYTYTDEQGNTQREKGIFHTVWKKQSDGNWKYVWD